MEHESHESNKTGSFAELPQPQEAGSSADKEVGAAGQPETRGKHMPQPGSPQPSQQSNSAPQNPQSPPSAAQTVPAEPPTDMSSAALMADDTDLIEKEWVMRAKAIVAHTKDDPHTQNREMNKVKADYLKKRYNKDLKQNEG